jgi:hypothetical protein
VVHLHACVVHNHLVVQNIRELLGDLAAAFQEKAVSQLHDVGFVHSSHLAASIVLCIVEGILGYTNGCLAGDDLDTGKQNEEGWNDVRHIRCDQSTRTGCCPVNIR